MTLRSYCIFFTCESGRSRCYSITPLTYHAQLKFHLVVLPNGIHHDAKIRLQNLLILIFKFCNVNSDEGTLYHVPKAQDIVYIVTFLE